MNVNDTPIPFKVIEPLKPSVKPSAIETASPVEIDKAINASISGGYVTWADLSNKLTEIRDILKLHGIG